MMLLMMIVLIRKGNIFLLLFLLMKAHATFFHIDGKKTCTRTHARTPRQGEYSRLYIIVTAMCKSASPTLIRVMIVAQVLRRALFFLFFFLSVDPNDDEQYSATYLYLICIVATHTCRRKVLQSQDVLLICSVYFN